MSIQHEFFILFGVWPVAQPYIGMIVQELEMQLVVAMQGQALMPEHVAQRLGTTPDQASALLEQCYARSIVDKTVENGLVFYRQADFGKRLDHFAKFENWDDIPAQDRQAIDRRFVDEFTTRHRPNVAKKMRGHAVENALPNDTVMLLSEIEAMIDAATHIVVQPCDCRRMGQKCNLPVETCIWMDDGALDVLDRGHGRRLTNEEAKELVRRADRAGLMHTADSEWRSRGLHAICNCCACDCYPFRAAQVLGSKGVWPKSRYIAVHDPERCTQCGDCVKRCHFDAFYRSDAPVETEGGRTGVGSKKGSLRKNVLFVPERCWGCGLCANSCPAGAIKMARLEGEPP
jgi:NAD-dependent dihydropyrimidine dehydrogenase PreA subunit